MNGAVQDRNTPILVWNGADYPRVPAGNYQAIVIGFQGPEWVRSYGRWSLRLEFELISENAQVSAFYNFGSDRAKPHIGRLSRFYRAWVMANGEQPRRRQIMSLDVFKEGQIFLVQVEDARVADGEFVYSKVSEIVCVVSRANLGEIFQSSNRSIRNQEPSNQPINQSS